MKLFLDEEEERDIKNFIKELMKDKKVEENDFIESGGLGVRLCQKNKDSLIFEIYRTIGYTSRKLKKKQ